MATEATTAFRRQVLRVPGAQPAVEAIYEARHRTWGRVRIRRDGAKLRELSASRDDLRLNVGAGSNHMEGWLSLDLRPDDICLAMDATRPWPVAPGSAGAINSEHMVEHLSLAEARRYFTEAFRALAPGGLIRTTTPNLKGLADIYLAGEEESLATHQSHGYVAHTPGQMFNNYFYSWDHRHIHDLEGLALLLREAGFEDVTQARFGESSHPELRNLDRHDPDGLVESILCVDAVRPALSP